MLFLFYLFFFCVYLVIFAPLCLYLICLVVSVCASLRLQLSLPTSVTGVGKGVPPHPRATPAHPGGGAAGQERNGVVLAHGARQVPKNP